MEDKEDKDDYCPKEFHEMELDDRILKAVAKLGWLHPTLIQERAIPLLLEGKDVLMRARTGSGKTGAFGIPAIQKVLNLKQVRQSEGVRVLVLSPSRELCRQIHSHMLQLANKCAAKDVKIIDISPQVEVSSQKPLLAEMPDIVVATPARAVTHLRSGTFDVSQSLSMIIIDEADLIFSFGRDEDIKMLVKYLPRIYQACLASATLSEDVLSLKRLLLHNAVTLKLEEPALAPVSQLVHYYLYAEEEDKATILYTMFKLTLVRGKTIVFTNTVDKCYKLKLYLEQFHISSCVLNSELPASVRCHTVAQFNEGLYNIIIASDEMALESPAPKSDDTNFEPAKKRKKVSNRKRDKTSGVARGIDFQFVSNVINFDFPLDVNSYIHRAGRTARGTNQGTALSLISVAEKSRMEQVEKHLQEGLSHFEPIFKLYEMRMEDIEGFRYRSRDAWRATTRIAVREARLKEIKNELLNNTRLKGYFADNPRELKTLRHDKFSHTVKLGKHLSHVPEYLVPDSLKKAISLQDDGSEATVISEKTITPSSLDEILSAPDIPSKKKKQRRYIKKNKFTQVKQGNPLFAITTGKRKK